MAHPGDTEARLAMNQVLQDLKLANPAQDDKEEESVSQENAKQPESTSQQLPDNGHPANGDAASDTSGSDAGAMSSPSSAHPGSSTGSSGTPSPQPSVKRPPVVDVSPLPEARNTMDDIIVTIRKTGRSTLSAYEDPLATMQFTSDKPQELENILGLLGIQQDRVAHEHHKKYVLLREGFTSYVYLAKCQTVQ